MGYTIGQVSWALNIHQSTLRRWEREGKIKPPARRPSGMREYSREDVEAIIRYIEETFWRKHSDRKRNGGNPPELSEGEQSGKSE